MSLYGAFDYLDVLSRESRTMLQEEARADESVSEDDDDDYLLLVLDDVGATTMVEESADGNNTSSEIHVASLSSEGSGTYEGITILPSLPSEEAARLQLEQQQLQALSMQVQGALQVTRNPHSTISLSTTETHFTEVVHDDEPSSVSSLSLSMMSSLPSSGFSDDLTIQSEQDSSTTCSKSDDESTMVRDVASQKKTPSLLSFLFREKPKNAAWYTNLKTEEDWENFRNECQALMDAMGEDTPKDPQEFIAQLIAEEEAMLYKSKSSGSFLGMSYETIAMLAGAALVPLVGYLMTTARNRRERQTN